MGKFRSRFKVLAFQNRAGSRSWRVTGTKRDGTRIRENFSDVESAQMRQVELEAEHYAKPTEPVGLRATKLSHDQIRLAEVVFSRLDRDEDILPAVDNWLRVGRLEKAGADVRLDVAVAEFNQWLLFTPSLRDRTKANLRTRVNVFAGTVGNLPLSKITADTVDDFLRGRNVSAASKINDRLALSRFFAWGMERPRRYLSVNPCAAVRVERGEIGPPEILSVPECEALLRAAEADGGRAVPYLAVCLFGGLRPFEASRLTWDRVNLVDREIALDGRQTKTGRPRVVKIDETLDAWLRRYPKQPFNVGRRILDKVRMAGGFVGRSTVDPSGHRLKPWTPDGLRHTGVSHFFRRSGSYGLTAEWAGNSETIIKNHYQGRVSSEETAEFYALRPAIKNRKSLRS